VCVDPAGVFIKVSFSVSLHGALLDLASALYVRFSVAGWLGSRKLPDNFGVVIKLSLKQQQQQPPFNGLCSGTTRVGRVSSV